jgi:hypothetical protein
MNLCEIFEDYKDGVPYAFETEFETLHFDDDNRYEKNVKDLTRVVRKSFYESISQLTGVTSYNQSYFFLPSHVCEQIDNFLFDFSHNDNPNESSIEKINKLICDFKNEGRFSNDDSSTSFFLVQNGVDNCNSDQVLLGLKDKVTQNTEEISILKGDIEIGVGLLHRSKKYTKPAPKFKHVSFWKNKTGTPIESFGNIFKEFQLLEKNDEINE